MKTKSTVKNLMLALTIALSFTACKKDKKGDPNPTPVEVKAISITDLKALSTSASVKIPDGKKVTGIVISDVSNKNIDSKTVILQDPTTQAGIIITFDAAQSFALGDQVEVNVSNQTLAQVNGEIEVINVPSANGKKTGTGTITAKSASLSDVLTNKATWDGTLVTIASSDLTLTGGSGKFSGTLSIANSTGSVSSNVLAGASFENTAYPVSVSSITGIVRIGATDTRVDIRKSSDVITGAITRLVTEDWTNFTPAVQNATTNPQRIAGAFTTAAGPWAGGTSLWYIPGATYDGNISTSGKSYPYLIKQGTLASANIGGLGADQFGLENTFTNSSGLKSVSVTFAGSNMSGNPILYQFVDTTLTSRRAHYAVKAFDPNTEYFQIAVVPQGVNIAVSTDPAVQALFKVSDQYTDAGKLYTVTWTVPTKDQLLAAGVTSDTADAWLANPQFTILNTSKSATGIVVSGSATSGVRPILINKVVLGF